MKKRHRSLSRKGRHPRRRRRHRSRSGILRLPDLEKCHRLIPLCKKRSQSFRQWCIPRRPYKPTEAAPGRARLSPHAEGNDALAWVDKDGEPVTESQFEILKAAECAPDTPALPRQENHHQFVGKA